MSWMYRWSCVIGHYWIWNPVSERVIIHSDYSENYHFINITSNHTKLTRNQWQSSSVHVFVQGGKLGMLLILRDAQRRQTKLYSPIHVALHPYSFNFISLTLKVRSYSSPCYIGFSISNPIFLLSFPKTVRIIGTGRFCLKLLSR